MVEQSRRNTHLPQLSDFIKFIPIPKAVNPALIKDFYLKSGLFAAQIAERTGLSKASVLARLHKMGIKKTKGQGRSVANYRFSRQVPFGKRLVDGQLIDDRRELKVARLIVELRRRRGFKWQDIVNHLNKRHHRTKHGQAWKVGTARMIFARWKDKF